MGEVFEDEDDGAARQEKKIIRLRSEIETLKAENTELGKQVGGYQQLEDRYRKQIEKLAVERDAARADVEDMASLSRTHWQQLQESRERVRELEGALSKAITETKVRIAFIGHPNEPEDWKTACDALEAAQALLSPPAASEPGGGKCPTCYGNGSWVSLARGVVPCARCAPNAAEQVEFLRTLADDVGYTGTDKWKAVMAGALALEAKAEVRERVARLEEALRAAAELLRKPKHSHNRAEAALTIIDAALAPADARGEKKGEE
jgi:hypothetical protein